MAWPITNKVYRCSERGCGEKLGGLLNPTPYRCTNRSCRRVFCSEHTEGWLNTTCPRCGNPVDAIEDD
jgi:transcription initiation factor IIE alpha subunit